MNWWILKFKKYDKYFEINYDIYCDDEQSMKNQIFVIMAFQEEPIPEEIEEEFSDSFYNIIFTPKILILKNYPRNFDFNWGLYDYTLFGLIGEECEHPFIKIENAQIKEEV